MEPGGSGESEEGAERRYPTRERRVPGEWFRANMAADMQKVSTGSTMEAENGLKKGPIVDCASAVEPKREAAPEPQTYEKALAGADAELWRKAMDEEFTLLLENGTWELEKLPDGFKALPMK
jgi:hypothetical protein